MSASTSCSPTSTGRQLAARGGTPSASASRSTAPRRQRKPVVHVQHGHPALTLRAITALIRTLSAFRARQASPWWIGRPQRWGVDQNRRRDDTRRRASETTWGMPRPAAHVAFGQDGDAATRRRQPAMVSPARRHEPGVDQRHHRLAPPHLRSAPRTGSPAARAVTVGSTPHIRHQRWSPPSAFSAPRRHATVRCVDQDRRRDLECHVRPSTSSSPRRADVEPVSPGRGETIAWHADARPSRGAEPPGAAKGADGVEPASA
jgi:hypothetical protein